MEMPSAFNYDFAFVLLGSGLVWVARRCWLREWQSPGTLVAATHLGQTTALGEVFANRRAFPRGGPCRAGCPKHDGRTVTICPASGARTAKLDVHSHGCVPA